MVLLLCCYETTFSYMYVCMDIVIYPNEQTTFSFPSIRVLLFIRKIDAEWHRARFVLYISLAPLNLKYNILSKFFVLVSFGIFFFCFVYLIHSISTTKKNFLLSHNFKRFVLWHACVFFLPTGLIIIFLLLTFFR